MHVIFRGISDDFAARLQELWKTTQKGTIQLIEENDKEITVNDRVPFENHTHEWIVYSTALSSRVIMVECVCGSKGIIENPSKEWSSAYHAPSKPYRWQGGDNRVKQIKK